MSIHVKTAAGWEELGVSGTPGELPGLGGWAEITEVSGSPKRYAYNDGPGGVGGFDWVAFEWTQDGDLTTQAGGLVDVFLISGGGGAVNTVPGGGGRTLYGVHTVSSLPLTVTVGAGGPANSSTLAAIGHPSKLGTLSTSAGGFGTGSGSDDDGTAGGMWQEMTNSITGVPVEYGRANKSGPRANRGDGGDGYGGPGSSGVVIVRVPAALAAGVDPNDYNDITTFDLAKQAAKDAAKSAVKETVKNKRKKR